MISLREKIESDLKQAMKARKSDVVSVLRMVIADIKNAKIKKGQDLLDSEVLNLVVKGVKTRKQSIVEFEKGKREDLVRKEEKEIKILQKYLPQELEDNELEKIINKVIEELGANSIKDMGKVMSQVIMQVKGRAEGQRVSFIVKQKLSNV